ncbi:MAG: hypothetical protein AABX51_04215 [Nanoarchaeota archaeon]
MSFLAKKKKPPVHHSEPKRKLSVYEKTLGKIGECVGKVGANRFDEAIPQFLIVVRSFFSDFIPIHYKFTYEELRADIEKKQMTLELKKKISVLLTAMSEAEYHPDGMSKEQMYKMLLDFGEIVELLKDELAEIPAGEAAKAKWATPLDKLFLAPTKNLEAESHIKHLLTHGQKQADKKDVAGSRQTYEEINTLFETLAEEQKKAIYLKVMDFYHKLVALS